MKLSVTTGKPIGLPDEGSAEWVQLLLLSTKDHAGQAHYDAELAQRDGKWLRDHPEAWGGRDWPTFCREVLEEDVPGWIDYLIDSEPAIRGKPWSEARRDYADLVAETPAAGEHGGKRDKASDESPLAPPTQACRVVARLKREQNRGDPEASDQLSRIARGESSPNAVAIERGWKRRRFSVPEDVVALAKALARRGYQLNDIVKAWPA